MDDIVPEAAAEVDAPDIQTARVLAPDFAGNGLGHLTTLGEEILDLREALLDIESFGGPESKKKAQKLVGSLDAFEPSITMIGQIKSGKTSLVNAMAGRPELLPADVNPWTSVITSLHLNTPLRENSNIASFQFFDQFEWDHLVENGGRIGELSARAGASDELEKIRAQIAEMREKTKARLGRKFELLLGQTHNYRHLDDELMQRYVCMGDDFGDPDMVDEQGKFADITKSADLFLDAPSLPMALCIRDTPGVNDTFMMREQITINALRGSRICVVVLSATQALSSMDMGLIRLISNVKAREVVIFVNRIDELANPAEEIPEIRESILKTLADNNGPDQIEVLFGSAYWANMALQNQLNDIVPDSAASLVNFAQAKMDNLSELMPEDVWDLSGVPGLYDAIGRRIAEGEGAEMMTGIRKRAMNQLHGLRSSSNIVSLRLEGQELKMVDPDTFGPHLDEMARKYHQLLNQEIDKAVAAYTARIDQVHKSFLDRALESLLQHLETVGENQPWQYSPDGLRMLLRSRYQNMRKSVAGAFKAVAATAAKELTETYTNLLTAGVEGFAIAPPSVPEFPPPVTLGQTIALDLQSSWWKGWWQRRRGYRAQADAFYELIAAETQPIMTDLKEVQIEDIRRIALAQLDEFILEQCGILTDVSYKSQISVSELKNLFGITKQEEREALFDILSDEFATDDDTPFVEEEEDERPRRRVRPSRPVSKRSMYQTEGDAA